MMDNGSTIYNENIEKVLTNIKKVMIGKEEVVILSLTSLLAAGHLLIEDVPGVGKTMLVRALAKSIGCDFKRIQFTPDLLPTDITGVSIYNPKSTEFEFRSGPIFGNIILADEINRTSPKTQSSLLEAMEEHSVTIDGKTLILEQPFFVMATQNPIEYEGTYPLPEAQLDRFLIKLSMGYPTPAEELEMLEGIAYGHPIENIEAVITTSDVIALQVAMKNVYIEKNLLSYITELADQTRHNPDITLGVSPRGSIALMRAAKAYALIHGRMYVLPDDVLYLIPFVWSHRIKLTTAAKYQGRTNDEVLESITEQVKIPIHHDLHQ